MSGTESLAFLPGLLCDGALWQVQVKALDGRVDCRVADFTSQDSVAAMARTVLETMPERFALAGLSMGGYVAMEVMRQAPERITRLALLDTKARPDTAEQTERRNALIGLAEKGRFKGVTPRLLPLLIHEDRLAEDELPAAVIAMSERVGKAAFLRQQKAILGRSDSLPTLVTVRCPTLVLCGRQDQLTPLDCHTEMAAGIADARLVVVEDCGHLAPMEHPEAVTDALRAWLEAQ